jgi:hypothetical protein
MTTIDPWEDLPAFDMDSVQPFYAEGEAADTRNAAASLPHERVYRRCATDRHFKHQLAVANAAKTLDALPAAGESVHIVMRGSFNAWDFVPAIARLAAPATIGRLTLSTLGFARDNTVELLELLDSRTVAAVDFLCSVYFKSVDAGVYEHLHAELTRRGQRVAAVRTHAKVLCFELTDGRPIVIESSANLRSCHNAEACCITSDAGLLEFHREWITYLLGQALCSDRPKR